MNGILIVSFGLVFAVHGRGLGSHEELYLESNSNAGEERIVGGAQAADHSEPWTVYVQASGSLCGGALVQPQWVLTAAHCADENPKKYKVVAGTNQICKMNGQDRIEYYGDGVVRKVSKIFMTKYNNVTGENDIALMKLKQPFTTTGKNIKTIALATNEYSAGSKLQSSGWGDIYAKSQSYVCFLRTIELPVVTEQQCRTIFKKHNFTFESRVCAGYSNQYKSICDGDSGGPLVDLKGPNPLLVGVTSQGPEDCNDYSTFSKVKHFSKWILDTMKKN